MNDESDTDDHCHPVVNVEETIGKTVGRRVPRRGLSIDGSRKVDKERWREAVGGVGVPRGVFRYNSHEEADQWLIQEIDSQESSEEELEPRAILN